MSIFEALIARRVRPTPWSLSGVYWAAFTFRARFVLSTCNDSMSCFQKLLWPK